MQDRIVQAFGRIFYAPGQKALAGQIFGLFLVHANDTLTLDEITRELYVSKGPVSQCVRELVDSGMVKKSWQGTGRRHLYRFADDAWKALSRTLFEPIQQLITLVDEIEQERNEADRTFVFWNQLKEMQSFSKTMVTHKTDLIKGWSPSSRTI